VSRFRRLGVVLEPPTELPWSASHAAVPFVDPVDAQRLYFTTRDEQGRSHVARASLDLAAGTAQAERRPVLDPGPLGAFDDSGAMGSCLVRAGSRLFLFYTGWNVGATVPFRNFAGCAIGDDDGATFRKLSAAPILGPDEVDPYLAHSPWVLIEDGRWRMWYCSGTGWELQEGRPRPRYHIKYAESGDGIRWHRDGHVCIDYEGPEEYAISRPVVVRDADRYRMWFSARGDRYRLGYAESTDGLTWNRADGLAGLEPSASGWDSEMVCYPCVFDVNGERHMLYNGNGYGRTGVGHAVLEL
jgi:hypothetical protein